MPISNEPIPTASQITATISPAAPPIIPTNLENLFASLVHAGLLTNNSTNVPAPAIVSSKESEPELEGDESLKESAIREYRNAMLLEPVKLTTLDLAKYEENDFSFYIYSHSSLERTLGL